MGLKKLAARIADYNERLAAGEASRIAPEHVLKVLAKLRRKEADLIETLGATASAEKRDRLTRKLVIAREHIARAEWLLTQID